MILGEKLVILGGELIYFLLLTDMSVPSITNHAKLLAIAPAYLQVKWMHFSPLFPYKYSHFFHLQTCAATQSTS